MRCDGTRTSRSPSSSVSASSSSTWLCVDAFERSPRIRSSQGPSRSTAGRTCCGCEQLTVKYAGDVSASTEVTASASAVPSGSRPSVSTVNERTAGMPSAAAARDTPSASLASVIVSTTTSSAPAAANDAICPEWYSAASSGVDALPGADPTPEGTTPLPTLTRLLCLAYEYNGERIG